MTRGCLGESNVFGYDPPDAILRAYKGYQLYYQVAAFVSRVGLNKVTGVSHVAFALITYEVPHVRMVRIAMVPVYSSRQTTIPNVYTVTTSGNSGTKTSHSEVASQAS